MASTGTRWFAAASPRWFGYNLSVAPSNDPPGQPGTITTTAHETTVALSWVASSGGPTGYEVIINSLQDARWPIAIDVGNSTSYIWSGLVLGEDYDFSVRAYNKNGYSEYRTVTNVATVDESAPQSMVVATTGLADESTSSTITVKFTDYSAIDTAQLFLISDIKVVWPDTTEHALTVSDVSSNNVGNTDVDLILGMATGSIPGGSWDKADNGVYVIKLITGTVRDTLGNTLSTPRNLGAFVRGLSVRARSRFAPSVLLSFSQLG